MSDNTNSNNSVNAYLQEAGISSGGATINDLREREYSGKSLNKTEKLALANFDKFRITELNKPMDDITFHKRYKELQIMANLGNYDEFLKEKYSNL